MDENEIIKKYKLSKEEHEEIYKRIEEIMLYDKKTIERPKAIIDIAPPGSGKTALNAYGERQFEDNNVIIVNGDEIRNFYPNADRIAKEYPNYYHKITNQESAVWTRCLFETILENKYNVIFEGTGRTTQILDTINTKMKDYDVTVRGMAVDELNCLMSILIRYKKQCELKGSGRLTTLEDFDKIYLEMINTIEKIEQSNSVSDVEVFKRGKNPAEPQKIYSSDKKMECDSLRKAIISGRIEDRQIAMRDYEKYSAYFDKIFQYGTEEEQRLVKRIRDKYNEYRKTMEEKEMSQR